MLILGSEHLIYLVVLLVTLGVGVGLYAAGVLLELCSEGPRSITDDDPGSEFGDLVISFNCKGKSDATD